MGVMSKQEAAATGLPRLLRYSTVAKLLCIGRSTLKKLIALGQLEVTDVSGDGNMPRISTEEYLRFLAAMPKKEPGEAPPKKKLPKKRAS